MAAPEIRGHRYYSTPVESVGRSIASTRSSQKSTNPFADRITLIAKEPEPLEPIKRSIVLRALDIPGKIPILSMAIGAIRFTGSFVVGFGSGIVGLSSLGLVAATDNEQIKKFSKKCYFVFIRSTNEATRALTEFSSATYFEDRDRKKLEKNGKITNVPGAYGKYAYRTSAGIVYSYYPLQGLVKIKTKYETTGDSISKCVEGRFDTRKQRPLLIKKLNEVTPFNKHKITKWKNHPSINVLIAEYVV